MRASALLKSGGARLAPPHKPEAHDGSAASVFGCSSLKLRFYVYRLIDARTGETFYVGKGNSVFAHVKGERDTESDGLTQKLQRRDTL